MKEFIELFIVILLKIKVSYVEEGFKLIDINDDGFIDFEEFLFWW